MKQPHNVFIEVIKELGFGHTKHTERSSTDNWRCIQLAMERYADLKVSSMTPKESTAELLNRYSMYLEKERYMDTDWREEEPSSITEFMKENAQY